MRWRPALLLLTTVTLAPGLASGEGIEERLREALRTTTAQLRALESENAAQRSREAELKRRVAELQEEVETLRKGASTPVARRAPAQHQHHHAGGGQRPSKLTDKIASLEASLATCEESVKASAAGQAEDKAKREAETKRLGEEAARLRRELAAAGVRTTRVDQVGRELIQWVSSRGMGAAACEPFTQIRRVELENLVQRYKDILATEAGGKDRGP